MNAKKGIALLLALLMTISMLVGCGAAMEDSMANDAPAADAPAADFVTDEYYEEESGLTSTEQSQTALPADRKIITTMNIDAETDDMDPLLETINAKIAELGGYMQSQDIYNGSSYNAYRYRNANLTVRIPAEKLNSFVEHVNTNSNIISRSTNTDDVTLSYIATESRIAALETEQTRLLELLAMAENMEEILLIESRLTEVRTELEQVTSTLRSYDNRINYSTVYLYISEVKEYTDTQEPETFWDRISKGFAKSLKNVGEGIVDFCVFLIVAIPYLLPIAAVAVVVILLIVRKKKKEKEPPQQDGPK